MLPMTALLYTAELDLADEDIRPFLDWYAYRHAPDLFPIGFMSCACYRTAGTDMNLFDIYEIPSHAVFSAPGYGRMNARDPYAGPLLEKRRNKAHTIYEQIELPAGAPGAEPGLDADWITVARFDAPGELGGLAATLTEGGPDWSGAVGLSRARLGIRTENHPVYTTFRPRCMLVLEWSRQAPAGEDLRERLARRMNMPEASLDVFSATRLYPWPTSPDGSAGTDG
jgi:hypothetical protein